MESHTEAIRKSEDTSESELVIEVRCQMDDGTVIFQHPFALSIPVAALKPRVLAEWPQDRGVIPKSLDDIGLQIEGKDLEDSKTLADCTSSSSNPVGDLITVIAAVNVRDEIQEAILEPPVRQRTSEVPSDPREQRIRLKFWLNDGKDICQGAYPSSTTIAALKEMLIAEWPKVAALKQRVLDEWPQDREVIPESLDDIMLQIEGKVLEDSKTLAECASNISNPVGDLITAIDAVNVRGEYQDAMEPPVGQRMTNVLSDPREQRIELKFRLHDGTDICHGSYPFSTSVAALKEMLIAEWPKECEIKPESVNGLMLVLGAKILENSSTLAECRREHRTLSGEVITVHTEGVTGKEGSPEGKTSCSCCKMF